MAEEGGEERTEEATARREEEARKHGQIPRSRELSTLILVLTAASGLLSLRGGLMESLADQMRRGLTLTPEQIRDPTWMGRMLLDLAIESLKDFFPLVAMLVLAAIVAPLAVGGWNFSSEALGFKFERINPLNGLGRIFSSTGLMELGKGLIKFALIAWVGIWLLKRDAAQMVALGQGDLLAGLGRLGEMLLWDFMILAATLAVIAGADVPFQIWNHSKQLKMTRQEVREEAKESDGRPEVKGRIRQMQREMSQRRMMAEVPKADVIVTNPTHFAVALRYDPAKMRAPRLVAKGADLVATRIRQIGDESRVARIEAPGLARALYYNAELDREIPAGLYKAVAQVLAFVFQIRKSGKPRVTPSFENLPIPEELRR